MTYEEYFDDALSKIMLVLEATNSDRLKKTIKTILLDFDKKLKLDGVIKESKKRRVKLTNLFKRTKSMSKEEKLSFFKSIANKDVFLDAINTKRYKRFRKKKNKLKSNECYICGEKAYCMHHVVPLISGGTNKKNNLIPICIDCHKKIHDFMK